MELLVGKLVMSVCSHAVSTEVGSYSQRLLHTQVSVLRTDTNTIVKTAGYTQCRLDCSKGALVVVEGISRLLQVN